MSDDAASLLTLLEEAPAAIAVLRGPELRWEVANPMFRGLLGGRPLVGYTLAEVLPDWAQLRRIVENVWHSGERFVAREHRFLVDPRGDFELREAYFDFVCQPLRDGGAMSGVVTFAVDVTAQVEARHRLEAGAVELRQAIAARDDFLSVASHELRTPLTALRLQVQSVHRSLARPSEAQYSGEQLRAKLEVVDRQVQRLVELVETLLDVTRLQAGHVDVTVAEVDLVALGSEVLERSRGAAQAVGSMLTLEAPAHLTGHWDRLRVDQVLTNLVSNAIKYGGGKPVRMVVSAGAAGATVTVIDEGIGIASEDQERIFHRFERAVSRRHFAGLGLGLWISRQIAGTLGGAVAVESELGCGSRFTLTLPL